MADDLMLQRKYNAQERGQNYKFDHSAMKKRRSWKDGAERGGAEGCRAERDGAERGGAKSGGAEMGGAAKGGAE
uniref:Uncharacterized protein n=1 Tax=Romanomermis culicivorax TaxID=13658 RepID=A0A915JJB4_ROMCU